MTFDVTTARQETPGCENVLHFNNAGAALMPQVVRDTLVNHIDLEFMIGGYEAANQTSARMENVYASTAKLIGAEADEIGLLESATHAWVMAFYSIPFKRGDKILTARAEYAANYIAFMQVAKQRGVEIEVIPNDDYGQISVDALRNMIDERVKLIAITHIPTNGGLINSAEEIGKIAREAGVLYLLDACQTVGQKPVNVQEIGCDFLSATSRKFLRGPRGIGFLYIKRQLIDQIEPVTLDHHSATWITPDSYEMRSDARRFEKWEASISGRLAFGAAVDYALSWGVDAIWERIQYLSTLLRQRLAQIPAVLLHDLGENKCGIVTFTVAGLFNADIKALLAARKINVTLSGRSATLLDMDARDLQDVVRASVHYYNTEQEIERFCEALEAIMG